MVPKTKFKKILVVDDDQTQIKIIDKRLSSEGYEVMTTQEAADGLQMAMDKKPDLILLDVMMPIINGYNFCKLLKDQETHRGIPIVLVTSRDALDDVKIGMEMGAEAYLMKPVNMDELIRTIKMLEAKA